MSRKNFNRAPSSSQNILRIDDSAFDAFIALITEIKEKIHTFAIR